MVSVSHAPSSLMGRTSSSPRSQSWTTNVARDLSWNWIGCQQDATGCYTKDGKNMDPFLRMEVNLNSHTVAGVPGNGVGNRVLGHQVPGTEVGKQVERSWEPSGTKLGTKSLESNALETKLGTKLGA